MYSSKIILVFLLVISVKSVFLQKYKNPTKQCVNPGGVQKLNTSHVYSYKHYHFILADI